MGKYMKKAKMTGDVAVMEVSQSSFGVRTRAKTLAMKRLQSHSVGITTTTAPPFPKPESCYLVLRSRRLEKRSTLTEINKQQTAHRKSTMQENSCSRNHVSTTNSAIVVSHIKSGSNGSVSTSCCDKDVGFENKAGKMVKKGEEEFGYDLGIETSFGENNWDFDGRERTTRESTPCSLIKDVETVGTPGSTSRQTSFAATYQQSRSGLRNIPTSREMEEFFAFAEQQQQRIFMEKYNFDIVNDMPLPGRYDWVPAHL